MALMILRAAPSQDVAADHVDLYVEPVHGLLHVPHVLGGQAHQIGSQPQVIPQSADFRRRDKPAGEQTVGVQHRQPLAIFHVRFAPRDVATVSAIDHHHFKPGFLQHVVEVDPIDPGGLHRHRLHPFGLERLAQFFHRCGHRQKHSGFLASH